MNTRKTLEAILKKENTKLPMGVTVNWDTTPIEGDIWDFKYKRSTITIQLHKINEYDKEALNNKKVNLFSTYNGDETWSSADTLMELLELKTK